MEKKIAVLLACLVGSVAFAAWATTHEASDLLLDQEVNIEASDEEAPMERTFEIEVPSAGNYIFETFGELDTELMLRDMDGTVSARDDNSGWKDNARISRQLENPGTYELVVRFHAAEEGKLRVVGYDAEMLPNGIKDDSIELPRCADLPDVGEGFGTEFGCLEDKICRLRSEPSSEMTEPSATTQTQMTADSSMEEGRDTKGDMDNWCVVRDAETTEPTPDVE